MAAPTRFPSGVTNANPNATLGMFGLPDPSSWHVYFNDFNTYLASDWVVTETQAGATQALAAGDGGLLALVNSAGATDVNALQSNVGSFLMEAGKPAVFKARFKLSEVIQCAFVMGLQIIDPTPLDPTDGIWFQSDDGDALIDVYVAQSAGAGTISSLGVASLVADTYLVVGWYFDGDDTVSFFINEVLVAQLTTSSSTLPNANLAVSFGEVNGETVAKTMTVDYVLAAKKRTTLTGA